jgi:nitrogen regulatory protein P-II 1
MKKIEIIVPDRELQTISGIFRDNDIGGMIHFRVEGKGKTKAEPVSIGRGTMQYTPEFIPRTKIESVVKDELVEVVVNALLDKLSSKIGGKIFITDIQEAIDIRTKSKGNSAL